MTKRSLKEQLTDPSFDVVYSILSLDALSARLAEQAGFTCGYVSGGALGYAHAVSEALLTMDELADVVRHVSARSELDIVVDGGVGFGDPVHVGRAVQLLEQAGASAVEIEDQVAPKRVSHHRGLEHLVGVTVMVDKVKAAVDARNCADTLIIARTGAVKNESLQQACERAAKYVEAGADAILITPEDDIGWQQVCDQVDVPKVSFGALAGKTQAEWAKLGVSLVIDPFTPQVLQVQALQRTYADFFAGEVMDPDIKSLFTTYNQLDDLAGFGEYYALEDETTEKTNQ